MRQDVQGNRVRDGDLHDWGVGSKYVEEVYTLRVYFPYYHPTLKVSVHSTFYVRSYLPLDPAEDQQIIRAPLPK